MIFKQFFTNYIVMSALIAWFAAQGLKIVTGYFKNRKFNIIDAMFGSGGMPSSHSAAVMACAVATCIVFTPASFEFAVAGVLAMVVVNDAMGVRLQAGKHAVVLNEILEAFNALGEGKLTETKLKEFVGHTPIQVMAGIFVGLIDAVILYALWFGF